MRLTPRIFEGVMEECFEALLSSLRGVKAEACLPEGVLVKGENGTGAVLLRACE